MSEKDLLKYAIAGFVIYNIVNPPKFISYRVIKTIDKNAKFDMADVRVTNRWFLSKYMWAKVMGKDQMKYAGLDWKV